MDIEQVKQSALYKATVSAIVNTYGAQYAEEYAIELARVNTLDVGATSLTQAFVWHGTPQGHIPWIELHRAIFKNHNLLRSHIV